MIPASLSLAEERVTDTTTLTPEQIAERRNGIGASEVAAVLGIDPFKTAIDVWAEKTGRRPHEELAKIPRLPRNEPMTKPVWDPVWFGIRGEQEVADAFTAATGKALRRRRKAYRLKDSVMLAHCDRIVVGENADFEAKTTNPFATVWGAMTRRCRTTTTSSARPSVCARASPFATSQCGSPGRGSFTRRSRPTRGCRSASGTSSRGSGGTTSLPT